jgi:hypothetical protein
LDSPFSIGPFASHAVRRLNADPLHTFRKELIAMSRSSEQSFDNLNVPLLRRVAETLLSHDPDAHRGLNIQTCRDDVILRGVIVGEDARDAAVALVRSIAGVAKVEDRLIVRPRAVKPTALEVPVTVAIEREPWWQRAATPLAALGLVAALALWQFSRLQAETVAARLPTLPVEGSVFVGGVPAAGTELTFHPLDVADLSAGKPRAAVDEQGRFRVGTYGTDDGAPPGHYVVTARGRSVPEQFNSPRTTPLFVEIADGNEPVFLDSFHLAEQPSNPRKVF